MGRASDTAKRVASFHALDAARLLEGRAWAAGVEAALAAGLTADDVVRQLTTRAIGAAANPYGLLIRDLRRLPEQRPRPSAPSTAELAQRQVVAARQAGRTWALVVVDPPIGEREIRDAVATRWPENLAAQAAALGAFRDFARRRREREAAGTDTASVDAGRAGLVKARQALGGRARGRRL